jgi:hypothetical protein
MTGLKTQCGVAVPAAHSADPAAERCNGYGLHCTATTQQLRRCNGLGQPHGSTSTQPPSRQTLQRMEGAPQAQAQQQNAAMSPAPPAGSPTAQPAPTAQQPDAAMSFHLLASPTAQPSTSPQAADRRCNACGLDSITPWAEISHEQPDTTKGRWCSCSQGHHAEVAHDRPQKHMSVQHEKPHTHVMYTQAQQQERCNEPHPAAGGHRPNQQLPAHTQQQQTLR